MDAHKEKIEKAKTPEEKKELESELKKIESKVD